MLAHGHDLFHSLQGEVGNGITVVLPDENVGDLPVHDPDVLGNDVAKACGLHDLIELFGCFVVLVDHGVAAQIVHGGLHFHLSAGTQIHHRQVQCQTQIVHRSALGQEIVEGILFTKHNILIGQRHFLLLFGLGIGLFLRFRQL